MGEKPARRQWRFYKNPQTRAELARSELAALPVHGRAALAEAMTRYRDDESLSGEVKKLSGSELWEIRVRVAGDAFRAIFFHDSGIHCVCVVAVQKKAQRLPRTVLDRARKRMENWQAEARAAGMTRPLRQIRNIGANIGCNR